MSGAEQSTEGIQARGHNGWPLAGLLEIGVQAC